VPRPQLLCLLYRFNDDGRQVALRLACFVLHAAPKLKRSNALFSVGMYVCCVRRCRYTAQRRGSSSGPSRMAGGSETAASGCPRPSTKRCATLTMAASRTRRMRGTASSPGGTRTTATNTAGGGAPLEHRQELDHRLSPPESEAMSRQPRAKRLSGRCFDNRPQLYRRPIAARGSDSRQWQALV